MNIMFLGTKGYIKTSSPAHKYHTSTLFTYKKTTLLIDCGLDWLSQKELLKNYAIDAILITHAHPDHAWGLKEGTFAPIYASPETIDLIKHFPINKQSIHIMQPNRTIKIGDITITRYNIEHSIRCPASSFMIEADNKKVFYSGDVAYLPRKETFLQQVDLYIGDGASFTKGLIRKRDNTIFGHAAIATQLTWCAKAAIPYAIFTHCGTPVVSMGYEQANNYVQELGKEKNVKSLLAYDGLHLSF